MRRGRLQPTRNVQWQTQGWW